MDAATLVVCSDTSCRSTYSGWLRAAGYPVAEATSAAEAVAQHRSRLFPLTVAEQAPPSVDGVSLIEAVRAINPLAEILLLSRDDSVRAAVAAMKAGASDLLLTPIRRGALVDCVRKMLGTQDVLEENRRLRDELYRRYDFSHIVAQSPQMLQVLDLAGRVARRDNLVLITGESGTGKELLARAIHANSQRSRRPLVSVNCAAIPESLIESELFGYRRGAFTGAHADKSGLIEAAEGGTLFLDEVAELSSVTQAKLLRFLDEGTYFAVGSSSPCTADVRIIAATNRSLFQNVQLGSFREDLYYRLSAFPLHLPPLRQRPEDIVLLAHHFLRQFGSEVGRPLPGLSRELIRYLTTCRWRGNARELRNAIERAVIVSEGNLLTSADFREINANTETAHAGTLRQLPDQGINLPELNRELVAQALERTGHNVSAASRLLGLNRPTLRYRMKKYKLTSPDTANRKVRTLQN